MSEETIVDANSSSEGEVKPKRQRKPKPAIRMRKRRPKKSEIIREKKMIFEEESHFRIQFPEEMAEKYEPILAQINGAVKPHTGYRIPFDPEQNLAPEQITYCLIWKVRISEETLQQVADFGRRFRFSFDSDLALRANASSAEGKELERMSYAKSLTNKPVPKWKLKGTPKPFQWSGAAYMLRTERTWVADEMGLGKTIEAILGMSCVGRTPWLIVVPSSLRINWLKECRAWLPKRIKVAMMRNRDMRVSPRGKLLRSSKEFLNTTDVFIMTYDKIHRFGPLIENKEFVGIIFDESHYIKAPSTKRTIACKAFVKKIAPQYRWLLSGTPLMNKPVEMIGQLQIMDRLNEFGGYNHFLTRYCQMSTVDVSHVSNIHKAGKADIETATETDEDGNEVTRFDVRKATDEQVEADKEIIRKLYENMTAMNKAMRSLCFLRREKMDVLKDLPPKTRQTIPIALTNRREYDRIEEDVIGYLSEKAAKDEKFLKSISKLSKKTQEARIAERKASKAFKAASAMTLVKIEALKQAAAIGKLKGVKEWVDNYLESGKKLVIFATHKMILNELEAMFPDALSVRADMSVERRQATVEEFQSNKNKKLIFMGLKLAVGFTLTAAADTCTIEYGWNPAQHDQAEDRTHRIGQKFPVTAYYLPALNTIEEKIGRLIEKKRRIVNSVADGDPLKGEEQGSVLGSLLKELTGGLGLYK
jgi:SWI/SNF-related matrix-associated actin-dependent regulator 1 of chromatin subfamily A